MKMILQILAVALMGLGVFFVLTSTSPGQGSIDGSRLALGMALALTGGMLGILSAGRRTP